MIRKRGLLALLVAFLSAPLAFAQTTASIEGTVKDGTGGALPGVTVQVVSEQTGITRNMVTDAEGRYRARDLALGAYRVEASLAGFQTSIRRGVVLTIGREAGVDFQLAIGELSETVEVSGDAPLVDITSAGVASLVSREQMADLPLNARDFSQLINLQAGTVEVRMEVTGSLNAGMAAGARISVSGARPSANVFVLDGTEIQTAYGTLPSGVGGATLGLEAVQEFKVLTSNYSAQHGRSVGGTVVAATRSGTNDLRGTGYWYHRNDAFDSSNFFDVAGKPDFSRHQFGGGLGGPIVKNRTFFFANLEHLRERLPLRLNAVVPTAAARLGTLPTRTVTVANEVKPYLALWPLPSDGGRDFGDGTGEYLRSANRPMDQTYSSLRIDHQFSGNSSVFARYTRDVSELISPDSIPLFENALLSRNHYATVEHNQVLSSRLVNQVRVSFTRTLVGTSVVGVNPPDPSLEFYEGRGFGTITVTGMTGISGGAGENTDTVDAASIADAATFDVGGHSIHVGGVFSLIAFDRVSWGDRFSGQFEFPSLVNFLQNGQPSRLRISGFNADPERNYRNRLLGLYLQDDIRLRPNLVLNVGMRYDYLSSPTETDGRLANLRGITDTAPTVGEPYYENPGGFFSPRIGLVWDPTGDGTTSVRTGFGFFHEPLHMKSYVVSMTRQPPFWTEVAPVGAQVLGIFPNVTPHLERLTREAAQAIHVFEFQPSNPYSLQGSLTVQRQLAQNFVLELGYVGSHGLHLPGKKEWATAIRTVVDGESFFPREAPLLNPTFSRFNYYDTSASSWYHAFKATATKRVSSGLHFQGAYTWSKSMDTESNTNAGELEGQAWVMDAYDPMRDWAVSNFHVNHVFTGSASYQIPWGRNLQGLAAVLARGWQVSGIVSAVGGSPFSVASNSQLTHPLMLGGARPDLTAGGNHNPILGGHEQYFDPTQFVVQRPGYFGSVGRNTLVGPGMFKLDLSAVKEVSLGGHRNLQVRMEAFNVTNRVNLGRPASGLFTANGSRIGTAGRITDTSTTARQGQVAIRLTF